MSQHADLAGCCHDCKPRPLTRNHFFTSKLLVERDFTDEQWFFREKIRLHHQRLHGTGVVCGLEITQYPNANCQDRLVVLHPGSAIDCCGHDILVADNDVFDITSVPAVNALIQAKDTKTHVLQFCLKWRECPTEEVPVLYDECGCDDTQCMPNRILESFALEVTVDPPPTPAHAHAPKFDWHCSIPIADPIAVALDETNQRIFVVTGGATATLYQVGTQYNLIQASVVLNRTALDLAIAPDGSAVYVAVAGASSSAPPELWVFTPGAATGIAGGAARTGTMGSNAEPQISLSVTSDGRLLAVANASGNLWLYAAGVPNPVTAAASGTGTHKVSAATFSSDGKTAWLGETGNAAIDKVDLTQATLSGTPVAIVGISADGVALVSTGTGADRLAVIDQPGTSLHLIDPAAANVIASATLAEAPQAVLVTQGGGGVIVMGTAALQAVNLVALANGATDAVGAAFPIPASIGRSALTASARRLFVPFTGSASQPGGVAIVHISEADCRAALRGHDCPACDTPDCLVLATISGWQVGFKLEDVQDPPTDPAQDAAAGIARIDNSVRTVLASTQAITRALQCTLDETGVTGPPGPPGSTGPAGPAGPSGLRTDLTGICAISWPHNAAIPLAELGPMVIAFSAPVNASDLHAQSVRVFIADVSKEDNPVNLTCWCQVPLTLAPINLTATGNITGGSSPAAGTCNAVQVNAAFSQQQLIEAFELAKNSMVRVQVHGDLIRDTSNPSLALDGNHLPPWLTTPPPSGGQKTGDGVAGGLFESWFTVTVPEGFKPLSSGSAL